MLSSTDQHEPVQQGATAMSAWARRLLFLRIILITVLLIGILFWLSSKVIVVLLILLVAALLAYAVVPVIDRLHRIMPRVLAMVLVYLVAIVSVWAPCLPGGQDPDPATGLAWSRACRPS